MQGLCKNPDVGIAGIFPYGLAMDFADHTTEDLVKLRDALGGWFADTNDREALIEEIRQKQDCADRHMQPERPGVVW